MRKMYLIFGLLAPLCYIAAVVVGGSLIPGYDHLYNTISELTASNAPKLLSVQALFSLYNLFVLLFGLGLHLFSNEKLIRRAGRMLVSVAVLGLAMYYFPQDPRGVAMSFAGKMHLILAGIMSPLTMLAMILIGIEYRHASNVKMALYSFVSCLITFVTGGLSALSVAQNSSYGGLFERLTIGSFIQWIFVMAMFSRGRPTITPHVKL